MEWEMILGWLIQLVPAVKYVLMIMGSLAVVGAAYVKITPTQDDDAWFAKLESIPVLGSLLKALLAFSPISRKE